MEKKKFGFVNTGASFLLVIFTVLCLVTFATLSVVSANADKKLAQSTTDNTTAYYAACSQAEEGLAALDDALAALYPASGGQGGLEAAVAAAPPTGWTWDGGARTLTADFKISDSQKLAVAVTPHYPGAAGEGYYTVSQWQVENTGTWTPSDTTLNLLPIQ